MWLSQSVHQLLHHQNIPPRRLRDFIQHCSLSDKSVLGRREAALNSSGGSAEMRLMGNMISCSVIKFTKHPRIEGGHGFPPDSFVYV